MGKQIVLDPKLLRVSLSRVFEGTLQAHRACRVDTHASMNRLRQGLAGGQAKPQVRIATTNLGLPKIAREVGVATSQNLSHAPRSRCVCVCTHSQCRWGCNSCPRSSRCVGVAGASLRSRPGEILGLSSQAAPGSRPVSWSNSIKPLASPCHVKTLGLSSAA